MVQGNDVVNVILFFVSEHSPLAWLPECVTDPVRHTPQLNTLLPPININYAQRKDEWSRCVGSGYQKDSLYRFGKFGKAQRSAWGCHCHFTESHKWWHSCANHLQHLRPNSEQLDSCSEQWNDLKIALKAKTTVDQQEATRLLATTHYKKNLGSDPASSPTAGYIWDLKDKPCWDEVE